MIVAAPTGSGKTLIAEYLVERCLRRDSNVIYTAPIKALSNQKFRDWSDLFGSQVGIVTGDVSIRPEAPLRIMTTEIFRNAIFDRPHRLDGVSHVIFDEVHYINDDERGTVWEESILFAPRHINFLCLSATIQNLDELARWLTDVRGRQVGVVLERARPVPLEHNLFIANFGVATLETLSQIRSAPSEEKRQLLSQTDTDVVKHVADQAQFPCLYFCHSRKRCEDLAFDYGELNVISPHLDALTRYDALCHEREIGQDQSILLLRESIACGIAYHHAGLLPGLKDVVERMFAEGLIRLIFTTETFALGLNLPASAVIFDRLEKFDGTRLRNLKPHEYHQMAGRAGRRGLDTQGHVYACVDAFQVDMTTVKKITSLDFEQIDSQLDPCYATILNLCEHRVTERGPAGYHDGQNVDWTQKSFRYFQSLDQLNQVEAQLIDLEGKALLPVECVYDQPHLIEEYERLSDAISQEKIALKKRQRESRRAKRDQKREAAQVLAEVENTMHLMEAERDELLCASCPHCGECMRRFQKLKKAQRTTNRLVQRKEIIEHLTPGEIERRCAFLASLEYIRQGRLTRKGRIASRLYGYEIQTTELLFDGYFDRLDEVQANILASAISFESRSNTTYQRLDPKLMGFDPALLADRMRRLNERQRAFGIEKPLGMLDVGLSRVVYAWSQGNSFDDLSKYTDAAMGDVIRGLRRAINLLRQLADALPTDTALTHKIGQCIARMKRGVVDAEAELRD